MPTKNRVTQQAKAISSLLVLMLLFSLKEGIRSLRRQDPVKALKYFQRCVELEDRNPDYLIHLAATYTELVSLRNPIAY